MLKLFGTELHDYKNADTFLIVDVSNLVFRAWFSKANNETLTTSTGVPSGHIYSVMNMLLSLVKKYKTDRTCLVFSWDQYPKRKYDLYADYKGNRVKTVDPMKFTYASGLRQKAIKLLNDGYKETPYDIGFLFQLIPHISILSPNEESDDAIASFISQNYDKKKHYIIYSTDQDMWQLIKYNIKCYGKKEVDEELIQKKYRIPLSQSKKIALIKSLYGDSSDNIPGVNSIKADVKPLRWDDQLKDVICNHKGGIKNFIDLIKQSKIKSKDRILLGEDLIRTNYKLIKLSKKLTVQIKTTTGHKEFLVEFLEHFECNSILPKVGDLF